MAFGQFQYPTPPLARPGGAQAALLAEVGKLEAERNKDLTWQVWQDYKAGRRPAGPGAKSLLDFFAFVDAQADRAPGAPATKRGDQGVMNLLARRAKTLHLGTANYCWFADPAKALCLKLAGTPAADQPLLGMCDAARCPQATHHPCHRPVWAASAENKKAFIAAIGRSQQVEKTRLQQELDRDMRGPGPAPPSPGEAAQGNHGIPTAGPLPARRSAPGDRTSTCPVRNTGAGPRPSGHAAAA
ncbi:hypothetical protein ACFU7Y_38570 [Kitasatospora sp. NPDC057542]|uniref:hypothetical protein n=1 Tax=Kitasatospora sp. NPDC057542 TaxID=3346162 RepID=UPI0036A90658